MNLFELRSGSGEDITNPLAMLGNRVKDNKEFRV